MKTVNITKTFLTLAICFALAFIFCTQISAQEKDVKKKKQKKAETTTETKTQSTAQTQTNKQNQTQTTTTTNSNERKKVIVVLDFDTVTFSTQKIEVGKVVGILLANEFSKNGTYSVIERQRLAQILREQDLTFDERFDPSTAATVGKALSANPVVLGSITEYTTKKSGFAVMGMGKIKITAKIGLAIRLVDVNTGLILDSVTVEGTATESGVNAGIYEKDTIMDEDLKVSLFTRAANNAVVLAVAKLSPIIDNANNFPTTKAEIKTTTTQKPTQTNQTSTTTTINRVILMPKVAAIKGVNIIISGLAKDVKVGDRFSIMRGDEIKDPDTGEVIDFDGKQIAIVEVIEILQQTVKAKIIKGTGIKIKDVVQSIK